MWPHCLGKTSIDPAASSLLWRALLFDIFWSSQGHKVPNGHFSELFLGFHYEVNIGVRHSLSQHHASSTLKGLGLTLKWLLAQRAWMVLRGGVSESQNLGGDAPDITRLTWSDLRSCDEVCQRRLDTKQVTSKELLSLGTLQGVYVRQNAAQVLALQFHFLQWHKGTGWAFAFLRLYFLNDCNLLRKHFECEASLQLTRVHNIHCFHQMFMMQCDAGGMCAPGCRLKAHWSCTQKGRCLSCSCYELCVT